MIAQDMTRLSGEIAGLHAKRAAMVSGLTRESRDRSAAVAALCTRLSETRSEMAKKTKSERAAFMNQLKHEVNTVRRAVAMDLAEVRRVWSGGTN